MFVGAVVSLAWLAIGFNLAAVNSPAITIHERSNVNSHCAAFTYVLSTTVEVSTTPSSKNKLLLHRLGLERGCSENKELWNVETQNSRAAKDNFRKPTKE